MSQKTPPFLLLRYRPLPCWPVNITVCACHHCATFHSLRTIDWHGDELTTPSPHHPHTHSHPKQSTHSKQLVSGTSTSLFRKKIWLYQRRIVYINFLINIIRNTMKVNVHWHWKYLQYCTYFTALRLFTNAVAVPNLHYHGYTANSNLIPTVFPWHLSPFAQYYRNNCPLYRGKYRGNRGITAIPIPTSIFTGKNVINRRVMPR